tara:strand:+ start:720 stop:965 length:246 start_codon:yes stop_codon:yes gene_type:complete
MDKAQEVTAKMMGDLQKKFPGLTPELAMKTILVESLKSCKTVLDLTKLPIDPSLLRELLNNGLIDQSEYSRIMKMLDPSQE